MKAFVPNYHMKTPKNFAEACAWLAENSDLKPFAGGTDLMVLFEAGKLPEGEYLNLWGLRELRGIEIDESCVRIKALTTYTDILNDVVIRQEFPMLTEAARWTGAVAIQNRGTVGGNIANASPAADTPPALLSYDAEIEMVSRHGSRWLPYKEFHKGYKLTDLRKDELVASVRMSRKWKNYRHHYHKVGTRKAQAISKVCFAGALDKQENRVRDLTIGMGSVAPIPLRCLKTENFFRGKILDAATLSRGLVVFIKEISPIDDIRSTQDYRFEVAKNILRDFLEN